MADKGTIVDEHFWFTATIMAVNGFIISSTAVSPYAVGAKCFSAAITLYAVFLIVHRSAAYSDKLQNCYPERLKEMSGNNKTFVTKAWETWCHFKIFPGHLLFVICEFSGALFYLLLAVTSCVAVWIIK